MPAHEDDKTHGTRQHQPTKDQREADKTSKDADEPRPEEDNQATRSGESRPARSPESMAKQNAEERGAGRGEDDPRMGSGRRKTPPPEVDEAHKSGSTDAT